MKKNIVLLALLIVIGTGMFLSCKKKDTTPNFSISGKIGTNDSFTAPCTAYIDSSNVLYVYGEPNTPDYLYPALGIYITNYAGIGTYTLTTDSFSAAGILIPATTTAIYFYNQSQMANSKSGTVTVTATTPYLTGTFNFMSGNLAFTNGTFIAKVKPQ